MSDELDDPAPGKRTRLQRELAQARAELEDFTYSVSHDLRASLRHVTAYVQIIEEDLARPGQRRQSWAPAHRGPRRRGTWAVRLTRWCELSRLGRVELQLAAVSI